MCAAIVTNFLPDSPSQDNLKSPTTPDMPEGAHLFAPESCDLTNGGADLSQKVMYTFTDCYVFLSFFF